MLVIKLVVVVYAAADVFVVNIVIVEDAADDIFVIFAVFDVVVLDAVGYLVIVVVGDLVVKFGFW